MKNDALGGTLTKEEDPLAKSPDAIMKIAYCSTYGRNIIGHCPPGCPVALASLCFKALDARPNGGSNGDSPTDV